LFLVDISSHSRKASGLLSKGAIVSKISPLRQNKLICRLPVSILAIFERKTMAKKIYQIKISLKEFKPKIWRRILVQSTMLLSDFHKVIQTTMGWTNSHLHQFIKNRTFFMERLLDDDLWEELNNTDYKKIIISDLLKKENGNIVYEYNFGDGWNHDLLLEKILSGVNELEYPICQAGEGDRPPEDCGGIGGYSTMLDILKNPRHEEYKS
jgi:hypothetical protein